MLCCVLLLYAQPIATFYSSVQLFKSLSLTLLIFRLLLRSIDATNESWFRRQESIISGRNAHLARFCQEQRRHGKAILLGMQEVFSVRSLVYLKNETTAFCPNGKTGTTSWFKRFHRMRHPHQRKPPPQTKREWFVREVVVVVLLIMTLVPI